MSSKDVDAKGGEGEAKNLVIQFCEYAFKVLQQDMSDFFEENYEIFDQSDEELSTGRGETLEQYDVYQQYLQELDTRFDEFAALQGFSSAKKCFAAINRVIEDDKLSRKQMMEQLQERLRNAQRSLHRQRLEAKGADHKADCKLEDIDDIDAKDEVADAKDTGEGKEEEEEVNLAPMIMFFQPMSMEAVLDHVMTLADYQTFSTIMRSKVRQVHLLRAMNKRVAHQEDESRRRKRQLKELTELDEIFLDLIDRICGLTPHHKPLVEQTRQIFPLDLWQSVSCSNNMPPRQWIMEFKRVTVMLFMSMMQLCSFEYRTVLSQKLQEFIPIYITEDADVERSAASLLDVTHDMMDDIEQQMVAALQAHLHKNKSDHRKAEAK